MEYSYFQIFNLKSYYLNKVYWKFWEGELVAVDRTIRIHIAVHAPRIIVAVDVAIRIRVAIEVTRVAVEVRTIRVTAP